MGEASDFLPSVVGVEQIAADHQVYVELAEAIVDFQENSTIIQKMVNADSLEIEQRREWVGNQRISLANALVSLESRMIYTDRFFGGDPRVIFGYGEERQGNYDRVLTEGLKALSPEIASLARDQFRREIKVTPLCKRLNELAFDRMKQAEATGDVASYMMWTESRRDFTPNYVLRIIEEQNLTGLSADNADVGIFVRDVEAGKHVWEEEAKIFNRLRSLLNELPVDPVKPRVAIVKASSKLDDSRRSVRVLIDFPPGTYNGNGGIQVRADDERRTFYLGESGDSCVGHSYAEWYRMTAVKGDDGWTPRPFYVVPLQAVGYEAHEGFPEAKRSVLQLQFVDGQVIPDVDQTITEWPGVVYTQKPIITSEDVRQVVTDASDGRKHFIMGRDEQGAPVYQETAQYAVDAILNRGGGYRCISVENLIDK